MKRTLAILLAFVLLSSHDMYLKLDTYFLAPNTEASIKLYNGTFDKSENVIDRNRMIDVSLIGNGNRTRLDSTQWSEKDDATILSFATGAAGTKVAGVSTYARNIEMEAEAFNNYLEHDGVVDMLKKRKAEGTLNEKAVEKYAKHVKTIFQVGETLTDDWQTELGYPIEFVPLANPYALAQGDELKVKLLWKGQPLANQLVLANFAEAPHQHEHPAKQKQASEHSHDHATEGDHQHDHASEHNHDHATGGGHDHDHATEHEHNHDHASEDGHEHSAAPAETADHTHDAGLELRTDQSGVLSLDLSTTGIGYLRTIYMTLSDEAGLTHESNWATLTFEVGHGHPHDHAEGAHTHADGTSHTHDHEEEAGFPSYLFYGGSLVLLLGLFFWFNRKK